MTGFVVFASTIKSVFKIRDLERKVLGDIHLLVRFLSGSCPNVKLIDAASALCLVKALRNHNLQHLSSPQCFNTPVFDGIKRTRLNMLVIFTAGFVLG